MTSSQSQQTPRPDACRLVVDSTSSAPSKSSSDTPCQSCTSSHVTTAGCLRFLFTAFQGNLDFCPFTDKTGQCKLLPKHQPLNDFHAVFRTLLNRPEHVYLAPVPDSTSEPSAFSSRNIPSQVVVPRSTLCTLFLLSVFPVKNSYAAQAHFECVGTVD